MTTQCKEWQAWIDTMPPKPDELHVAGEILTTDPGIRPVLTMREPQGINPSILMLDLKFIKDPGWRNEEDPCAPVKFSQVMPVNIKHYQSVEINSSEGKIAFIDNIQVVS